MFRRRHRNGRAARESLEWAQDARRAQERKREEERHVGERLARLAEENHVAELLRRALGG